MHNGITALKNYPFLIVIFLFLLNLFLRFLYISEADICIDEPFSIYHAQFPVNDLFEQLKKYNNPPLFELILHYWIKWFGISPFSVRFLPALFASLTVIFIYKIAQSGFNLRVAVTASLLYTFSSFSIFFSHDSRVYSLFLLLSAASFYFFFKINRQSFSKVDSLLFCLINVLLVYSHYFGFIVWFIQALYILFYNRRHVFKITILFFISLLLYLPQILVFLQRFSDSSKNGTWLKETVSLESMYNKLWAFSNMPLTTVFCIVLMFVGVLKLVYARYNKTEYLKNTSQVLIYLWFFIPFFALFAVSFKLPVYLNRYLIFITPAYYILLAHWADTISENKKIKQSLMALLIGLFAFTYSPIADKKREVQKSIDYVLENKTDNALVIVCSNDFITTFAYYYNINYFKDIVSGNEYNRLDSLLRNDNVYHITHISKLKPDFIKSHSKVIFLDAGADYLNPGNAILSTISSDFKKVKEQHFYEHFKVYVFGKNDL